VTPGGYRLRWDEGMGKGPYERERDFRSAIERAALARRRASGVRPWLGPLRFILRPRPLLTLALMCFVGPFVFIFGALIKWTDAYSCSLAEARRSPVVVAELGGPVEAGLFAGTSGYSREGSVTDTSFRTALAGPKGEGTLRVWWYSSPLGSSLRMELERGGRTHTVYGGAVPCR
jgi:hypothetical protein